LTGYLPKHDTPHAQILYLHLAVHPDLVSPPIVSQQTGVKNMKEKTLASTASSESTSPAQPGVQRRSFLKGLGVTGAALSAGSLLTTVAEASDRRNIITVGDVAILRFLAAAEILETDLWQQYNELAGIQDSEVPGGSGSPTYTAAVTQLDGDMAQYIHDNTEDEMTHEVFINAYLVSKGAEPVSLEQFRNLPSSQATGAQNIGRLTNLTQLTVDTSWWTRYRSRAGNPDLGDTFPQAIPTLAVGQHTAIPRTDNDLSDPNFLNAIAFTAGFHFGTIEQGGSSLYPSLAQRVTSSEVLRVVLSIGGTEIAHFQTWQDKAGNALPLTAVDPVTGVSVTIPNLNSPPFGGEDYQTNLIMPEPTAFLSRKLPACSIIRPTGTKGAAMGALKGLTADGLFVGQSKDFFKFMHTLAVEADLAVRE
jgi:TAT (twin-arginine translocation) pathway signal sequence